MGNWFKELNDINVSEHIEKKNGLNYLSWMWAWAELKKRYPLSYSTVHETETGQLVWQDPIGCHVKTSVTIVWEEDAGNLKEHTTTEYLPVMDYRNKAIEYKNVTATDVNKTIQRSLTKCIARLGLGAYIYAGEDLPEEEAKNQKKGDDAKKITAEQIGEIKLHLTALGKTLDYSQWGVEKIEELTSQVATEIIAKLKEARRKMELTKN